MAVLQTLPPELRGMVYKQVSSSFLEETTMSDRCLAGTWRSVPAFEYLSRSLQGDASTSLRDDRFDLLRQHHSVFEAAFHHDLSFVQLPTYEEADDQHLLNLRP